MSNPCERDSPSVDSCEHIFPRDRVYISATPTPPPPAKKRGNGGAPKTTKKDDVPANGRKPAMKDEAKGSELYTNKQPVKTKKKPAANDDDGNERPKKKSRAGMSGAGWDAEEEAFFYQVFLSQYKPDWSYLLPAIRGAFPEKNRSDQAIQQHWSKVMKRDWQQLAAGATGKDAVE